MLAETNKQLIRIVKSSSGITPYKLDHSKMMEGISDRSLQDLMKHSLNLLERLQEGEEREKVLSELVIVKQITALRVQALNQKKLK